MATLNLVLVNPKFRRTRAMWHEPVPQREQDFILSSLWALNPTIKNSKEPDLTTGTCLTSHIMRTLTIFLKKQRAENTFSFQQKELTATAMLNIPTTAIFFLAKKQKACPCSAKQDNPIALKLHKPQLQPSLKD